MIYRGNARSELLERKSGSVCRMKLKVDRLQMVQIGSLTNHKRTQLQEQIVAVEVGLGLTGEDVLNVRHFLHVFPLILKELAAFFVTNPPFSPSPVFLNFLSFGRHICISHPLALHA